MLLQEIKTFCDFVLCPECLISDRLFPSPKNESFLLRTSQIPTSWYFTWTNCILVYHMNFNFVKFKNISLTAGSRIRRGRLRGPVFKMLVQTCPVAAHILCSSRYLKEALDPTSWELPGTFSGEMWQETKDRISSIMKSVTRCLKGGN